MTNQQNIFANCFADNGLISLIYKEFIKLGEKNKEKWTNDKKRQFTKRDIKKWPLDILKDVQFTHKINEK